MRTKGLSVVLGTYNRKSFLKLTIDTIREEVSHADFPCEIIVIDGGSTDGTTRWLAKQKDIKTIIQHNRGTWRGKPIERRSWGYFMNLGFWIARGKYICMLSDDCLIIPGAIRNGYKEFENQLRTENVGAIAFFWRNWPVKTNYAVSRAKNNITLVNHGLFLKKALEEVGYIDEDNYFFYHADSDLCLRIWEKGYQILESPDSYIEHYSHANVRVKLSNGLQSDKDWETFYSRWKEILILDKDDNARTWKFLEKEYRDPVNTYKKFRWLHLLNSWVFGIRYLYKKIHPE
jgi:GT2 family glycosyltransferase